MIRAARREEAAAYLGGLNACFPGWGDEATFAWAFERSAGGPSADLLVATSGGRLVAGTAITYRRVERVGRAPETIGCMTGSWTLPEARRKGWFKALVEVSSERAAAQGCTFLVGWGAAANGSAGTLLALSGRVIDTAYLEARPDGGGDDRFEPLDEMSAASVFEARPAPPRHNRLLYSREEWLGQMIRRPVPAVPLRLAGGATLLLAEGRGRDLLVDADRSEPEALIAAAAAAARRSRDCGRTLQLYTADPKVMTLAAERGFASRPGYFYLIDLGCETGADQAPWWFCDGDRM